MMRYLETVVSVLSAVLVCAIICAAGQESPLNYGKAAELHSASHQKLYYSPAAEPAPARARSPLARGWGSVRQSSNASGGSFEKPSQPPEKGSPEGEEPKHGGLFKLINFVILAAGLGFLLRKPLSSFLADRADTIHEGLEEGRKALEKSQSQLKAIEEKLSRLEEEIASFKAAAVKEMEVERERLQRSAADEADKIVQAARTQIEISARAARLELKAYTADQALRLAEEIVQSRLDDGGRHRLVTRFMEGLKNGRSPGSQASPN